MNEKEYLEWGVGLVDVGDYNCILYNFVFFEEGCKFFYGEFFFDWYFRVFIEYGDNFLMVVRYVLGNIKFVVKVIFFINLV